MLHGSIDRSRLMGTWTTEYKQFKQWVIKQTSGLWMPCATKAKCIEVSQRGVLRLCHSVTSGSRMFLGNCRPYSKDIKTAISCSWNIEWQGNTILCQRKKCFNSDTLPTFRKKFDSFACGGNFWGFWYKLSFQGVSCPSPRIYTRIPNLCRAIVAEVKYNENDTSGFAHLLATVH
jgi:hypothetical protein